MAAPSAVRGRPLTTAGTHTRNVPWRSCPVPQPGGSLNMAFTHPSQRTLLDSTICLTKGRSELACPPMAWRRGREVFALQRCSASDHCTISPRPMQSSRARKAAAGASAAAVGAPRRRAAPRRPGTIGDELTFEVGWLVGGVAAAQVAAAGLRRLWGWRRRDGRRRAISHRGCLCSYVVRGDECAADGLRLRCANAQTLPAVLETSTNPPHSPPPSCTLPTRDAGPGVPDRIGLAHDDDPRCARQL